MYYCSVVISTFKLNFLLLNSLSAFKLTNVPMQISEQNPQHDMILGDGTTAKEYAYAVGRKKTDVVQ